MKDLMIYGAGGCGCEVACLIRMINERTSRWNLLGFLDDGKEKGTSTPYGSVLGGMETLNRYETPLDVVMAIGTPAMVKNLIGQIHNPNVGFPNLLSPDLQFYDEPSVKWGRGNIVGPKSLISLGVTFGDFNILNIGVIVGHGCRFGNYNSVMSSTTIAGDVLIGDENFIGAGSVVIQGIRIGSRTRFGAGSVVIRHPQDSSLYVGNPAMLKIPRAKPDPT